MSRIAKKWGAELIIIRLHLATRRRAGAQTMTAALAAVQERSGSTVAVFGYSGTVAVAHILLTTWGTVIVKLMSSG